MSESVDVERLVTSGIETICVRVVSILVEGKFWEAASVLEIIIEESISDCEDVI